MSAGADDRLQRLLGGDRLAELRKRLRRRFERAAPDQADDSFRVTGLTADEHAALALLSGRRPRFSGSLQIDLAGVDAALREAGIAASLRAALEQLDGPIVHLATAREEAQRLWSGVADSRHDPGFRQFLQAPAGMGLLKRLSGGDPSAAHELCDRVEAVLRCLPAAGLTRAQLAADVLGDPHALDNGRPVASLVLAVWRQVAVAEDAKSKRIFLARRRAMFGPRPVSWSMNWHVRSCFSIFWPDRPGSRYWANLAMCRSAV